MNTERRCPSGKLRYATEHDAQVELVGTIIGRNRGKHKRRECRWYSCQICAGWHLTSMPTPPAERLEATG